MMLPGLWTARQGKWHEIPFSYLKLCAVLEIWFALLSGISLALFLPFGDFTWVIYLFAWLLTNWVFVYLLEKLFWTGLPKTLRNQIPYDTADADRGNWNVRSYGDLVRLIFTKRSWFE